ncbi:MAG: hypothetical protein FWC13_03605 [Oscillospiraceae bacterium]|nr:hypothetical protein [Oscillospiraceae bacterium]MCL2248332.1 hypothetical protein [Oscillospiraceae bacterium]
MSNTYKNLLLALTFVCVIGLVVFFIMLIVINSGVEPPQPTITVADGRDDSANEDDDSDIAAGGFGGDDFTFDGGELGDIGFGDNLLIDDEDLYLGQEPAIVLGNRHSLVVAENTTLVIYSNDSIEFQSGAFDWTFDYIGDSYAGNATLDINVTIRSEQGLETDVIAFLESYTGFTVEFGGEVQIAGSGLPGYYAITHIETGSYEAWVYDLEGSEFVLVFVISYASESQRDVLYAILSSMYFI